jgi:anti-sigma factor RsiW
MRCETTLRLLDAYVDAELDSAEAAALETHLSGCAACREQHLAIRALKTSVRAKAHYYRAPVSLRAAVAAELGGREPRRPGRFLWPGRLAQAVAAGVGAVPGWLTQTVAAGVMAVLAAAITFQLAVPSAYDKTAADVISSHARSLIARQIVDVVSSDQHTVKPWFNGRLDFTPPVKDTAAEGFPLVGGRIDYVNERQVAALVYRRRQHYIDVFLWPSGRGDAGALRETARRGFTVLSWSDREFTYFTVSDLDPVELREFAGRLGAPVPKS